MAFGTMSADQTKTHADFLSAAQENRKTPASAVVGHATIFAAVTTAAIAGLLPGGGQHRVNLAAMMGLVVEEVGHQQP